MYHVMIDLYVFPEILPYLVLATEDLTDEVDLLHFLRRLKLLLLVGVLLGDDRVERQLGLGFNYAFVERGQVQQEIEGWVVRLIEVGAQVISTYSV